VRDKAEDAVRKAGALLVQERAEKKGLDKDLKRTKDDLEKLRTEATQKLVEDEELSDEDSDTSVLSTTSKEKDTEIIKLREIIRHQVSEMKTLKTETATLRRESKKLKTTEESHSDFKSTISDLKDQLNASRMENATLRSSLEDQEAINTAMDEKLAKLLTKVMKERAKSVVGKRDGQWQESVGQVQGEKELMGKVLLRQWGREEVGIVDEKGGEKQVYKYQYVKHERT
jgi:chromosome segregation ATPase